ncbi:hypothetical protein ACWCQW_03015 [Streptomyces mirabilis]
MPDTFGGEWHRPKNPTRGRSQRELQDRASFDNESATGCGAMLLLCLLVVATALGLVLS